MAEPTGWTDPAPSDWWHPADPPSAHHPTDPAAGIGEDFFAAIGADPLEAMLGAMNDTSPEGRVWVEGELARAAQRAPARPEAAQKHQDAAFRLGWPEHEVLDTIRAPSLVMHGDGDRVLPLQHAHSLAAGIVRCELVVMAAWAIYRGRRIGT